MNCKEGVQELIDQIVAIIHVIPQDQFARPMEIFNGSTLGKHFRHIHDFFACLIEQCHLATLDYALRKRDSLIETDKKEAIAGFIYIQKHLPDLQEDHKKKVLADFELKDGIRPKVITTVGRELMYGYDHAVHHLAIIKIGLKAINPNLPINDEVGVAASTIKHQYATKHGH